MERVNDDMQTIRDVAEQVGVSFPDAENVAVFMFPGMVVTFETRSSTLVIRAFFQFQIFLCSPRNYPWEVLKL